jgi:hypothetical protein
LVPLSGTNPLICSLLALRTSPELPAPLAHAPAAGVAPLILWLDLVALGAPTADEMDAWVLRIVKWVHMHRFLSFVVIEPVRPDYGDQPCRASQQKREPQASIYEMLLVPD